MRSMIGLLLVILSLGALIGSVEAWSLAGVLPAGVLGLCGAGMLRGCAG